MGKVYSREDLLRLVALAKKHNVIVISDEIHAPLTYKEQPFTPLLALGEDAAEVGVAVNAASKGWNIAGLKCAIIISQSAKMHEKFYCFKNLPLVHNEQFPEFPSQLGLLSR